MSAKKHEREPRISIRLAGGQIASADMARRDPRLGVALTDLVLSLEHVKPPVETRLPRLGRLVVLEVHSSCIRVGLGGERAEEEGDGRTGVSLWQVRRAQSWSTPSPGWWTYPESAKLGLAASLAGGGDGSFITGPPCTHESERPTRSAPVRAAREE